MTLYRHVVELVCVLLFFLRKSRYIGTQYLLHSNGVTMFFLVLCRSGILGKGTLRAYPCGRIPTHPFRVLGFSARGSILGEFCS